jgi:signal transduction histidine kinase
VKIEPDELEQVVVNLVMNAGEAIAEHAGTISVALRVLPGGEFGEELGGANLPGPDAREGWVACLEIRDTGHGMTQETQARMFDPFFTTRMTGRGLGLAVTLGIVQARSGTISVDSATGRGTTVRVLLPVDAGAGTAATE